MPQHIVLIAREWIGTPFHHQGRVKGQGCDCIGLIIGVFAEIGAPAGEVDIADYSMIPDGKFLQQKLSEYLEQVSFSKIVAGDILLFRFDKNPQHLAFYSGDGTIIHSYLSARKVVENQLDELWMERLVGCYRYR